MLTLLCLFKIATLTHHFPSSSGEGHRHLDAKEIKKFSHIFQNIALMTHVIKFTLKVVCQKSEAPWKSSPPVNKNQAMWMENLHTGQSANAAAGGGRDGVEGGTRPGCPCSVKESAIPTAKLPFALHPGEESWPQ